MVKIERNLEQLKTSWDLIIIGGGITGIATAREASARGLDVLLLEKGDFNGETSGATSKLIHGGLRYLENYEFGLVRESLRERRLLAGAAGHLMRPLPILIPWYRFTRPGRFLMRLGLFFYDLLSFDRNWNIPLRNQIQKGRYTSRKEILESGSCVSEEGLNGGFLFTDYQSFHPERLGLAFLKTAVGHGCTAINHAKVTGFLSARDGNATEIQGVTFEDTLSKKVHRVSGKMVVNASGPWMDRILSLLRNENPGESLNRSTGIHILTKDVCNDHAVFFRTKKGRHFFILPWMGKSLIGPTDKPFLEDPDRLTPDPRDVQELIEDANEVLPKNHQISQSDVQKVIIGIRPLISQKGAKGTYHASRKAEIYDHKSEGIYGLISVAGGKWTTSRHLGESVVKKVLSHKGFKNFNAKKVDTRYLPLFGFPKFGGSPEDLEEEILTKWKDSPVQNCHIRHLVRMYGEEASEILSLAEQTPDLAKALEGTEPCTDIVAQVYHAIDAESARTPGDVLDRRIAAGTLLNPSEATIRKTAEILAEKLNWDSRKKEEEIQEYRASFYPASSDSTNESSSG